MTKIYKYSSNLHTQETILLHTIAQTYPANKAISMPLTVQSRYIILHNWPVTATTFWCKHIKIIIPAVWFAIPLMESFFPKLFSTLSTKEMFSVPSLFKSSYTFLKKN